MAKKASVPKYGEVRKSTREDRNLYTKSLHYMDTPEKFAELEAMAKTMRWKLAELLRVLTHEIPEPRELFDRAMRMQERLKEDAKRGADATGSGKPKGRG